MKIVLISAALVLSGCSPDITTVKRGGDNTGLKDWSVEQTFKWGKGE